MRAAADSVIVCKTLIPASSEAAFNAAIWAGEKSEGIDKTAPVIFLPRKSVA